MLSSNLQFTEPVCYSRLFNLVKEYFHKLANPQTMIHSYTSTERPPITNNKDEHQNKLNLDLKASTLLFVMPYTNAFYHQLRKDFPKLDFRVFP